MKRKPTRKPKRDPELEKIVDLFRKILYGPHPRLHVSTQVIEGASPDGQWTTYAPGPIKTITISGPTRG